MHSLKNFLFLTVAAGVLSAGFHALGLLHPAPFAAYSDLLGFFQRAASPGFPYLSKNIEYPVLTGLFIQLMGYIGLTRTGYFLASSFFLILFACLTTYFLYALVPTEKRSRILVYWIAAPTFFLFLTYNWDIIPVFFSATALFLFQKEKANAAAASLALGASAKLFPALFLIPLLLKTRGWRAQLKALAAFIAAALAVNIFFVWKNFSGWYYFFWLNQTRNSNPDSFWTIIRFLFNGLSVPAINALSLALFVIGALLVLWRMRERSMAEMSLGLVLVFLLVNKVFTPQYLLWLLPFFVLAPAVKKIPFYALELSNAAVLFTILPWFFFGHDIFYFYLSAPFVILRHVFLGITLISLLRIRAGATRPNETAFVHSEVHSANQKPRWSGRGL